MGQQSDNRSQPRQIEDPLLFWAANCVFVLLNVVVGVWWDLAGNGKAAPFVNLFSLFLTVPAALSILALSAHARRRWSAIAPVVFLVSLPVAPPWHVHSTSGVRLLPVWIALLHVVTLIHWGFFPGRR